MTLPPTSEIQRYYNYFLLKTKLQSRDESTGEPGESRKPTENLGVCG